MRFLVVSFSLGAAGLMAACDAWETAPPPAPSPPPAALEAAAPSFEDNGCLAYLLLQRTAVVQGRAEGEAAALDPPIAAWRAQGAQTLSAEELTQYETSSIAEHGGDGASVIAERAEACVTSAPVQTAPTPAPN